MKIKELYEYEKKNGKGSEIRDEYHSMSELYFNRLILFSVLCNQNPNISWKSKKHEDGTMIPDFFIVGISTPEGDYCYHYQLKYWDLFNIKELEKSPHYDGHTSSDIGRLYSLKNKNMQSLKNEKILSNEEILDFDLKIISKFKTEISGIRFTDEKIFNTTSKLLELINRKYDFKKTKINKEFIKDLKEGIENCFKNGNYYFNEIENNLKKCIKTAKHFNDLRFSMFDIKNSSFSKEGFFTKINKKIKEKSYLINSAIKY